MEKKKRRSSSKPAKEKRDFLSKLTAALAAFTVFNYAVYLIKLLIFPEQPLAFAVTFAVLAVTILPIVFKGKIKKLTGKLFPVLRGVFAAGLAFYVLSFAFMCGYIAVGSVGESAPDELPEKTVFIVYGAKVNGNAENVRPGNALRKRLDYAVGLMEKSPGSVCIVTGGKGADEAAPEGEVMRDYLISRGIDEKRIYVDDKAENTIENIKYSKKIIEDELADYTVACVSSDFHIPRIQMLAKKYSLGAEYYYYAPCPNVFTLYTCLVREYMSYGRLLLSEVL